MMTVMTMPLGYPLAWGYIKISVIIVMTVTFTDKATGKPLIIGFPGAFFLVCCGMCCLLVSLPRRQQLLLPFPGNGIRRLQHGIQEPRCLLFAGVLWVAVGALQEGSVGMAQ